jgi:hypothetical protein
VTAFRCWLPAGERPSTPNVVALNAAFAAERFVERDTIAEPGDEVLVDVEDCAGQSARFRVEVEATISYHVRAADRAEERPLDEGDFARPVVDDYTDGAP